MWIISWAFCSWNLEFSRLNSFNRFIHRNISVTYIVMEIWTGAYKHWVIIEPSLLYSLFVLISIHHYLFSISTDLLMNWLINREVVCTLNFWNYCLAILNWGGATNIHRWFRMINTSHCQSLVMWAFNRSHLIFWQCWSIFKCAFNQWFDCVSLLNLVHCRLWSPSINICLVLFEIWGWLSFSIISDSWVISAVFSIAGVLLELR